jgi:Helix-turn-helix domain
MARTVARVAPIVCCTTDSFAGGRESTRDRGARNSIAGVRRVPRSAFLGPVSSHSHWMGQWITTAIQHGVWPQLTPAEQRLVPALLVHCSHTGRCYSSVATLAQDSGLRKDTVRTAVRRLVTHRLLTVVRRPPGPRQTHIYIVTPVQSMGAVSVGRIKL